MSETDKVREALVRVLTHKQHSHYETYHQAGGDIVYKPVIFSIPPSDDELEPFMAALRPLLAEKDQIIERLQKDNESLRTRFNIAHSELADVKQALAFYCDLQDGGETARRVLGVEKEKTDE
jgi:hypothetical protein